MSMGTGMTRLLHHCICCQLLLRLLSVVIRMSIGISSSWRGGRARIISIVRAGAETYCHEYSGVGVDEACEIIRKYLGRRDVEVLMEQTFNDVCNL